MLTRRRAIARMIGAVGGIALGASLGHRIGARGIRPATALAHTAPAPAAEVPPVPEAVVARAAVAIDAGTGRLLFARRPHDELPPASLTKMVTALVALERGAPDDPIEARRAYDVVPTIIGIEVGDVLRLEDALYGLMLNSGNDAAMAIAESVGGGSVERFVGWMNALTRTLGLANSRFSNPHGLDEPDHHASAYDMAIVGRAVMRHPVLARIVGAERRVIEGPPRWAFRNTNPLLGRVAGADGIKTGYEDRAGRCLAATAARDGRRVVTVVLNSAAYAEDSAALIDAAFARPDWGRPAPEAARPARRVPPAALRADLDAATEAPPTTFRASRLLGAGSAP